MTDREEFGHELRRERERRGIPLQAVAGTTKIGASLIAGLERGDCSRWPGGIYNRSYVRAYAAAIGLDPTDVAARFTQCFPESAPAGSVAPAPQPGQSRPVGAQMRLSLAIAPSDRRDRLRTVRGLTVDIAVVLGVAALLAFSLRVDFWMAVAAGSLACQAITAAAGGKPVTPFVAERFRSSAAHHLSPEETAADQLATRSA